jgi:DNA (cytosine-5)-methyltransferase 1
MLEDDVADISSADIATLPGLAGRKLDLLKACPPCQGFSSLRGSRDVDEARNDLVLDTLRFVDGLTPRAVLLENVRGLARDDRFPKLVAGMRDRGYSLAHYIVDASRLGVPQRRKRLVVVAVKGAMALPPDVAALELATGMTGADTAGAALARLHARIGADDPWHRWRTNSPKVAARIAAIPIGGNRFDLPVSHRLECHERLAPADGPARRNATGSYGRVKADRPSPTMTTRCTTPACGSFVHPTENRGLSLREAAALQTFPANYLWHGRYDSVERQIGNAVPVRMAEALGRAVLGRLETSPQN